MRVNFEESLKHLYSLGNEVLAMKLGLENISKLLAALGHPEKKYPKVQIAGTNGKGSTAAFLESICRQAGIKVGTTTSPHLVRVTERIKIDGAEISETDFARHATLVRETGEKLIESGELEITPTYFEQVTAIALNAFAEAKVELAILETGLGGRFDATTAANAEIVAITKIDYDHQRILGESLAEIAAEKAAIIRAGTKAVIAPQQGGEVERVVLERCREVGVTPVLVSAAVQAKVNEEEKDFPLLKIDFATENDVYHDIVLGLAGRHQIENALVAVNLAETLREFGFQIEKPDIWTGLEEARHAGRLELERGVLFDGAHNVGGARALGDFLDEFVSRPVVMIFGAMRDKDLGEIAAVLFPKADRLILTRADNPRSMETDELIKYVPKNFPGESALQTENAAEALKKAREIASANDLILVTGSLYLIGEAREIIKNQFES